MCCHLFLAVNPLRPAYSGADATVYSFWKLVPSLAGGALMLPGEARFAPATRLTRPPVADSCKSAACSRGGAYSVFETIPEKGLSPPVESTAVTEK
jgi:hypothetical protein